MKSKTTMIDVPLRLTREQAAPIQTIAAVAGQTVDATASVLLAFSFLSMGPQLRSAAAEAKKAYARRKS